MSEFIKIHPADNVAVAIHDVEAGGCFDIDGVHLMMFIKHSYKSGFNAWGCVQIYNKIGKGV